MADRWATFDCYGTLIDWDGGIRRELARLFGEERRRRAARRGTTRSSREIQARTRRSPTARCWRGRCDELGAPPERARCARRARCPSWAPFPEVPAALEEARGRGWRLAILSNTDRDFIGASKARIGVPFDETIVASEIGSYKPAHRPLAEFFARTHADRDRHVHVAASHFHDIAPANELGLPTVWVNRLAEHGDPPPTRELPDLAPLADVLDELVPA